MNIKIKRFALVHFDGPHTTKDVINESFGLLIESAPKYKNYL